MSKAGTVQAQLEAYNAQELDKLVSFFSDDIVVADVGGAVAVQGIDAYRQRQESLFSEFPDNRVDLLGRTVIGEAVIDHERVFRTPDATPFEVGVIYSFAGEKIARMDFVRG